MDYGVAVRPSTRLSLPVVLCLVAITGLFHAGCARPPAIPIAPPDGWTSDATGTRWWVTTVDTSRVFRNLETLHAMGAEDAYLLDAVPSNVSHALAQRKLAVLVKQSLLPLYRNRPDIVDSLFVRYVVPRMADARVSGDVRPEIERLKLEGYRVIGRHFRAPFPLTKLGTDIPVPVPDSLQSPEFNGTVLMQVSVDTSGAPSGIELIEGVHPVLDRIAMRATTDMRWQPAYVIRRGKSVPIASWARFKVRFEMP
jgi:hypothetical protein